MPATVDALFAPAPTKATSEDKPKLSVSVDETNDEIIIRLPRRIPTDLVRPTSTGKALFTTLEIPQTEAMLVRADGMTAAVKLRFSANMFVSRG